MSEGAQFLARVGVPYLDYVIFAEAARRVCRGMLNFSDNRLRMFELAKGGSLWL